MTPDDDVADAERLLGRQMTSHEKEEADVLWTLRSRLRAVIREMNPTGSTALYAAQELFSDMCEVCGVDPGVTLSSMQSHMDDVKKIRKNTAPADA